MKNYFQFILEKSSLISLGIPVEVMQMVQYDYEFEDDINWKKVSKKDIINHPFALNEKSDLFVGISIEKIFFLFSYPYNGHIYYNYDNFYRIEDDFGEGWERDKQIIRGNFNLTSQLLPFKGNFYVSHNKNYNITSKLKNKIKEKEKEFDKLTEEFKEEVKKKMEKLEMNISDVPQDDGTSELDKMIMEFEERYSEKEGEYITIAELINKYGMEKVVKDFLFKKI